MTHSDEMAISVTRLGITSPSDAVYFAWTSGDLTRMLAALPLRTNMIDRHFLLMRIVEVTYRRRSNQEARRICREIGLRHIDEFDGIAPLLREQVGGFLPRVSTFAYLATILAEDGELEKAIEICERAQFLGLDDGTKGNYEGRIGRLRKKQSRTGANHA